MLYVLAGKEGNSWQYNASFHVSFDTYFNKFNLKILFIHFVIVP